jgi:hypothetical protein
VDNLTLEERRFVASLIKWRRRFAAAGNVAQLIAELGLAAWVIGCVLMFTVGFVVLAIVTGQWVFAVGAVVVVGMGLIASGG